MKKILSLTLLILFTSLLSSLTSCAVFVVKDNRTHKGWYKNSNNPHHPFTTNPGHNKGKIKYK